MEPKININRPKVDDAEIESRKNFQDLVNRFKNESLQKARRDLRLRRLKKLVYSTVIAGATVFCTVTYINHSSKTKDDNKTALDKNKINVEELTEKKSNKFIKPISEKANVPYNNYKVNATHGGTITHNKSKITVPAGSFVKKSGEQVQGEVDIKYREMHDQADIIASGIPMTYDSAGTTYHFESAGMIDMQGSQNGEEIFIKPGKEIKVEMASSEESTRFNLYALDTVSRKWILKGKDKVTSENHTATNAGNITEEKINKTPSIVKIDEKIKVIEVKKDSVVVATDKKIAALVVKVSEPAKPKETKTSKQPFILDVDPIEHPELNAFSSVPFVAGDENKNYNKEMHEVTWTDAKLSDGPKKGENYTLDLYSGSRRERLIVYPVLTGRSLDKALKEYQKKFDQYQVAVKKRTEEEEKYKKAQAEKLAEYVKQQEKLTAERLKEVIAVRKKMEEDLNKQFNTLQQDDQIYRTFQVSNFGCWNADCPNSMPAGTKVSVILTSGNTVLKPQKFFLVDHSKNLVMTIGQEKFDWFSYPASGDYSLCLSIDNKVYVCNKEKFRSSKVSNGKMFFEFNAINPEVASVGDLRKGLGI
ncbi:MAG: hypothetical protein IAF38_03365 [Bacteroidia bacterium]|nr:hypothetical protein [Bacteroidia bacterium]